MPLHRYGLVIVVVVVVCCACAVAAVLLRCSQGLRCWLLAERLDAQQLSAFEDWVRRTLVALKRELPVLTPVRC